MFGSRSGFATDFNLSTLNGSNGFRLNGINAYDRSGRSVSQGGDINGDGIDDLLIGAPFADPNSINYSGQSYVVFGSRSGFATDFNLSTLNGSNGFRLNGINANDQSGFSVSNGGDINGDGIDDLIIGAYLADPNGSNSGQSYVVFGGAGIGAGGVLELSNIIGSTGNGIDFATEFTGTSIAIVDSDLTLVDANSGNMAGATVTITNLQDGASESLTATTTGTPITANYDDTNGVLTLSGTGTIAQYQQVLRTITYNNASSNYNTTPRIIEFVVDDGGSHSNTSALATTTLAMIGTSIGKSTGGNDTLTGGVAFNLIDGGGGNDSITGDRFTDTLRGGSGNDTLKGLAGNDLLDGGSGNDTLTGGMGNDNLTGGSGVDTLTGGMGNDTLTGGSGVDAFLFNSSNEAKDTLTDFKVTEDKIWVNSSGFDSNLLSGTLATTAFVRGSSATTSAHRFIYNPSDGLLSFDADGNGGGSSIELASLRSGLAMTNANIMVFGNVA